MARKNVIDDDENEEGDQDFDGEEEDSDTSPKKGQKRRKSAFIDDAASEDDEEEDDEDYNGNVKKKSRTRNPFLDDIAAVDDEEEEDDDEEEVDDLIGDEATEAADQEQVQAAIAAANIKARNDDINPEELERYIKERFEAPREFAAGSDFNEQSGMVSQQGLLPTHQDPKLWLVETRTGQEREACIRLMQKSIDLARVGTPLAIKSCFVQDHLQGYMYIEAFKEAHVMEAVRGLRNVLVSKGAKLVPLKEMVEAITVNTKAKRAIEVGSWVRMRRYPYQGDPAKVIDVELASQRAEIKYVPRLDYSEASQRLSSASLTQDGTLKKKAVKKIAGVRPPARAFSKQEAERHGLQPYAKSQFGGRVVLPGIGTEYEDGYEIKWVSMRNIVLDDVGPTVEELTRYNQVLAAAKQQTEDAAPEADNTELLGSLISADTITFAKGDKVKVTEGDLLGLWGYVHAVRDDNTVEMMPQLKELNEILPFPPSQLAKTFEVGDHVKVTGGQHSGQTGMVVHSSDRVCTLVSDSTKQELNCFTKDLSEKVDVAMGLDTFGKYELHDLVVLDQQTTGIIISVEKDTCRVLTTEGAADNPKIRICRLPDIKRKFPENRKITAPDANGNSVSVGDIVTIRDGSFAGRAGTVKFVVRGSVFIQSRDVTQHSGFVCLRSRAVVVKGAKASPSTASQFDPTRMLRSPAPHRIAELAGNGGPVLASPMRQGGFGGGPPGFGRGGSSGFGRGNSGGFGGRGMQRQDRIVGKSITIARGPYKGYRGRVVNATETHVRMELEAQYKTVTVPRTVLPMDNGGVPESANRRPAINAPRTPGYGAPQTPAYGAGNRTPMHAWGSRTPMHPGMTPSHSGSATPMHDSAWAAGPTPRHPSMEEDHTERYRDLGTPFTPADTPGAGIVSTPGLDAGTPNIGYGIASTPGLDTQTPATADPYLPSPAGTGAPTPAMASVPSFSDNTGYQPENGRARLFENIIVTIPAQHDQAGLVRSVDANGQLVVEQGSLDASHQFQASGNTLLLSLGEVRPIRPRKGDALRILEGHDAGNEGTLSSIADHEGVVKLDNAVQQQEDVVVVNMAAIGLLCRLQ